MAVQSDLSSGSTQFGVSQTVNSDYDFSSPGDFYNWIGRVFDSGGYNEARENYMNALDREYNAEQSALAYQRNALEAQKNRDFQERMSNTAYQRAVEDMKKAGINPILAFQSGGASTPSGSSGSSGSSSSKSSFSRSDDVFKDLVIGLLNLGSGLVKHL